MKARVRATSELAEFSRILSARGISLATVCCVALLVPAEAHGDLVRLKPSSYKQRSFVFNLKGVNPETIHAARLKPGGRQVGIRKVRKAARRGKLRVRRGEFRPRPPRKLGGRRLSGYRLVLRQSQLFAPSSFWNAPLAANAPLDSQSLVLVNELRAEVAQDVSTGTGPWLETNDYTTPLYTVPADQPTVRVALSDPGASWRRGLQAAFEAVPIPPAARPAEGTDAHMTIWQPAADRLWEFWKAKKDAQGNWQASWGGAMHNVSQNPGYYTRDAWPGAASNWGATATSLPVIGGVIRLEELARGRIDHALAINIPRPRAGVFSWPAQRTDGYGTTPNTIPEGARFRLDPNLDISALDLPPLLRMMAEAAQRHGMVVRDKSGGAIGLFIEHTRLNGPASDPFWSAAGEPRPEGYLQGKWPTTLLAKFPWDRLQLLRMELCSSPPSGNCVWSR